MKANTTIRGGTQTILEAYCRDVLGLRVDASQRFCDDKWAGPKLRWTVQHVLVLWDCADIEHVRPMVADCGGALKVVQPMPMFNAAQSTAEQSRHSLTEIRLPL